MHCFTIQFYNSRKNKENGELFESHKIVSSEFLYNIDENLLQSSKLLMETIYWKRSTRDRKDYYSYIIALFSIEAALYRFLNWNLDGFQRNCQVFHNISAVSGKTKISRFLSIIRFYWRCVFIYHWHTKLKFQTNHRPIHLKIDNSPVSIVNNRYSNSRDETKYLAEL